MSKKWIPNGDVDFATMAQALATNLAADPAQFEIDPSESEALTAAVARFRAAVQQQKFGGRSQINTRAKDDARAEVERIVRRIGHLVRSNMRLDTVTKMRLGIRPRAEKPKVVPCPPEPPRLRFVRALHEGNGATPVHELSFCAFDRSGVKPNGAVRIELFVDLVGPEEPIPAHPGANHGSRPWYLRSFTRTPIKLTPPLARVPMRVVYWGRWADSLGNVGPFSATAVAWIEGGSHAFLPGGVGMAIRSPLPGSHKPVPVFEGETQTNAREQKYSIAVLDAQFESLHPQRQIEATPQRQLQGPTENEAEPESETEAA